MDEDTITINLNKEEVVFLLKAMLSYMPENEQEWRIARSFLAEIAPQVHAKAEQERQQHNARWN